MRAVVFQHAAFEGLGSIERWLQRQQAEIVVLPLFAGAAVPATLDDVDLVIAMGGPMSVNDEAELPWLVAEKQFIAMAIAQRVPVVGVCLGAQLIANALGARVYPNGEKEIGWFPVEAAAAPDEPFEFPASMPAFHWHGETFDLPAGARLLASSEGCRHQAFAIGQHVIGLQFHPEMTLSGACLLAEHCHGDLTAAGPFVQQEEAILHADAARFAAGHQLMDRILDHVTKHARSAAA